MLSFSNIKDYLNFYCAPCLLGYKCANLFCTPLHICGLQQQNEFNIKQEEFKINGRTLHLQLLYVLKGKAYVMIYSKNEMEELFRKKEVQDALVFFGYKGEVECYDNCIMKHLFVKLESFIASSNYTSSNSFTTSKVKGTNAPFPHEIGLILGYPPQDVIQYYINDGKRYLFSGYWKVYTNPEWASLQFKKYDEARAYCMTHKVI